jgi:hypothetical protein
VAIEEEEDCDERSSYDGTRTTIPLEQPKIIASQVLLPLAHVVLIIGPCCALFASVRCKYKEEKSTFIIFKDHNLITDHMPL